jgi:hypothetical protein
MVETKNNEIRYFTSDPKKMLNKYLAQRVLKTWTEDFIDEDTSEVVSIERNELLFQRGTLIDQDVLAQIRFCYEAGDITQDIEVSNQKRLAVELANDYLQPYIAQATIDSKKCKFLFYATGVDSALLLLKDYIELNFTSGFYITMVKEFDSCTILTDSLKERKVDTLPIEFDENDPDDKPDVNEEEEPKNDDRKFYQIETKIQFGEDERSATFVVHTYNVDRAMMLITSYLKKKQDEHEQEAKEKGNPFEKKEIHTMIEVAKPISVGRFIPREFSMVYSSK